jgi:hypothetical protein
LGPAISDRGIGGTGIVGVITGFGSVFVDGLEVAYTPATPVTVDGEPDPDATLKLGQLATIVAGDGNGLHAVSIDLRHEVSGPVTSVTPPGAGPNGAGSDVATIVVSGQTVAIDAATQGQRILRPGDWVAVSGLRQPDGVIAASRIDPREPGPVLVRGTATRDQMGIDRGWRIGALSIEPPNGAGFAPGLVAGQNITARGTLANGGLSDTTIGPDVLSADPAAFFGGHVRRLVIESYVSAAGGQLRFGRGWLARSGGGVAAPAGAHRAIVELERGSHGEFVATHLRRAGTPREGIPRDGTPREGTPRGSSPHGGDRPAAPRHGDRHGALEPGHEARHPYGPDRFEPRPWRDGRPEPRRAGFERRHGRGPR